MSQNREDHDLIAPESDPHKQLEFIDKTLKRHGAITSAATFTALSSIYWKINNPGVAGIAGTCIFDRAAGDFLDFGGGAWLFVGTCSGLQYYNGTKAITVGCSQEYDPAADAIKWAIYEITHTYTAVKDPSAQVQYRSDISGAPQAIVVRSFVKFGQHNMHPNSYTIFR